MIPNATPRDITLGEITATGWNYENNELRLLNPANSVSKMKFLWLTAAEAAELEVGDKLEFICDYYTYDKKFVDAFYIGEPMTLDKEMKDLVISNVSVGDGPVLVGFCFTDGYQQQYWTPFMKY